MKRISLSKWLVPGILLLSILLTSCSGGIGTTAETQTPAEPEVYNNLTLLISPNSDPDPNVAVTKGALIRMSAQGFTPEARFRVFLGATGTDYKDPAATGKTDAEGKTTTIFNIPQQWDDGQPLTQNELLIIIEVGEGDESLTLKISYINE